MKAWLIEVSTAPGGFTTYWPFRRMRLTELSTSFFTKLITMAA